MISLRVASAAIDHPRTDDPRGIEPTWLAHNHISAPNPPKNATLHATRCEWDIIACGETSSARKLNKPKQPPPRRLNVVASD